MLDIYRRIENWQGAPDARVFARSALGARWIGGYFALLVGWAMVGGTPVGALLTAGFGLLAKLGDLTRLLTYHEDFGYRSEAKRMLTISHGILVCMMIWNCTNTRKEPTGKKNCLVKLFTRNSIT